MWFIGVEVKQETSAPPPKKNPGSAPVGTNPRYINVEENKCLTGSKCLKKCVSCRLNTHQTRII